MKALIVSGANKIQFSKEKDLPRLQEHQVLVKVAYSAMCSSDVKLVKGEFHGLVYPHVPGHEFTGVVTKTGEQNKHLFGKKVVVDTLMPCMQCEFCRNGKGNLCKNLRETGVNIDGGFAEYVAVDAVNVIPLADDMCLKQACVVEPLAVAYNALLRVGGIWPTETIMVLGCGAVGLLAVSLCHLSGAKEIISVDYISARLNKAKELGATTVFDLGSADILTASKNGEVPLADVVFDATGEAESFALALELVKPGGRIGYIGYTAYDTVNVMPSNIMLKEVDIHGVLSPFKTWPQAIELIEKGRIEAGRIITHEYPLEEYETLLMNMKNRGDGIIRGVFKLEGGE
jgi:2-desacetyl-2-hydroxyethyl bacteriochlorophyllide A dehydrogenase